MEAATVLPRHEDVQRLEDLLLKMTWVEYRRFWRELSIHQLTPSQFHSMVAIKESGAGCTMSYLADQTNQVSATVTGIIDRLVERGWVERYHNPADRRTVWVRLTQTGHAKLEAVLQERWSALSQCLANMDEAARHNLAFSLKQYLQVVESVLS